MWHTNSRGTAKKTTVTARKTIRRKLLAAHRKVREIRMIVKGLASKRHPLLAHIIPTRRCNLACTYCNEFEMCIRDRYSPEPDFVNGDLGLSSRQDVMYLSLIHI